MSKWISEEWLKEQILYVTIAEGEEYAGKLHLQNAPTLDIVHCRECLKRKKNKFCLEHMRYEKDDNGYCADGTRWI